MLGWVAAKYFTPWLMNRAQHFLRKKIELEFRTTLVFRQLQFLGAVLFFEIMSNPDNVLAV